MSVVNYRGYQGQATVEDGVIRIQILHINDVIIAECDSAKGIEGEFKALVDEYIEDCKSIGKEPDRPFKGSFNVRVSPELHKRAAFRATDLGESLNSWVVKAIELHLKQREEIVITRAAADNLYKAIQMRDVSPYQAYRHSDVEGGGFSLETKMLPISRTIKYFECQ